MQIRCEFVAMHTAMKIRSRITTILVVGANRQDVGLGGDGKYAVVVSPINSRSFELDSKHHAGASWFSALVWSSKP